MSDVDAPSKSKQEKERNQSVNVKKVVCDAVGISLLAVITGCMHGETFAEWKDQMIASDPRSMAAVEPNDTQVDERNREFLQEMKARMEKRGKFKRDVRLLPSQNVGTFLKSPRNGGIEANRRLLVAFAGRLQGELGKIKDFNIVGTEAETLAQLQSPGAAAEVADGKTYTLAFNILSLSVKGMQKTVTDGSIAALVDKKARRQQQTRTVIVYGGEIVANAILLTPSGQQRLSLEASVSTSDAQTEEQANQTLIDAAVAQMAAQYLEKKAPPAYVTQMHGNGLFAEITLGSDYGLKPNVEMEFYQNVKDTDFVTGKPMIRQNVVATGRVSDARFIQPGSSWVKVDLHHYRKVHLGTFVRVAKSDR